MHQNAFGARAPPGPPDPLAGFKGPTSKGREGRGKEGRGKEGERRGRKGGEGMGGGWPPEDTILDPPLITIHCLARSVINSYSRYTRLSTDPEVSDDVLE